jgi:hypothetical protein
MRVVLIDRVGDDRAMLGFVLIILLLIAGPLAVVLGVDSRVDDVARRRLGH